MHRTLLDRQRLRRSQQLKLSFLLQFVVLSGRERLRRSHLLPRSERVAVSGVDAEVLNQVFIKHEGEIREFERWLQAQG